MVNHLPYTHENVSPRFFVKELLHVRQRGLHDQVLTDLVQCLVYDEIHGYTERRETLSLMTVRPRITCLLMSSIEDQVLTNLVQCSVYDEIHGYTERRETLSLMTVRPRITCLLMSLPAKLMCCTTFTPRG